MDIDKSFNDYRFLVVEDNTFTSLVICKTLKSLGVEEIDTAKNGQEALIKIEDISVSPNIILLDLRMPGMGGVELLTRLADRKYEGQVILTSGVDDDTLSSVEKMARENNIQLLGALPKPLSAESLSAVLSKIPDE